VKLFTWSLTESNVKHLSGQTPIPTQALFDPGYGGSTNYRIPSLIKTTSGTLIAGADQRTTAAQDAPNDINFAIRRSTDNGVTWNPLQVLVDYPGTGLDGASVIDSVLVQNAGTGRIFAVIDRFPGGVGQVNSTAGTGFDASGRQILFAPGGAEYRLNANGTVVTAAGAATAFTVDVDGNVRNGGTPAGNIHVKRGVDPAQALFEQDTSFMIVIHSDDDGLTWSKPVDITTQVKASWMRFLGTGPGSGIQLTTGAHAGRLVVPVYFNNLTSPANVFSAAVIYSDDNGVTWQRSASPTDGRVYNGVTLSAQTLTNVDASTHEATVIQRSNGDLLMLIRNLTPGQRVMTSVSTNDGQTWGPVTADPALAEPFSQPNAIVFDRAAGDLVLFANATRRNAAQNGTNPRGTGTIRMSSDEGATWDHSKVFRSDSYVYNNLVRLDDNTFGILWELEHFGLYFSRVPVSWLEESGR
jgi:sialidase-1